MHGKSYISAFRATKEEDLTEPKTHEEAVIWARDVLPSVAMECLLDGLYVNGHVDALRTGSAPEFEEGLEELSVSWQRLDNTEMLPRTQDQVRERLLAARKGKTPNRVAPGLHDREQLAQRVVSTSSKVTNLCVSFSVRILTHVAADLLARGKRRGEKATDVAQSVVQGITTFRTRFAQDLGRTSWGIVAVTNGYVNGARKSFTVKFEAPPMMQLIQDQWRWLEESEEWDEALFSLCGSLIEIETLVALQEWVIAKRLPFVPVMAPKYIEQGVQVADPTELGNLHSDVLLCSMTSNEVVPIQVKNYASSFKRRQYHESIEFVAPEDLGNVTVINGTVSDQSGVHTGHLATTLYGEILTKWRRTYSGQTNQSRVRELHSRLEPAFRRFDNLPVI